VLIGPLVHLVARIPTSVHAKLIAAFLAMVVLLVTVGAVGLQVLSGTNSRAEELVVLQRKIAAYRQLQHDTTNQLYNVASALQTPDAPILDATLRQLNQFGYDFDRLQFVARDEAELLALVQQEHTRFSQVVTQVVELIRAGRAAEGHELQRSQAGPIADRLERLTNQLVNKAEADMVAKIDQNHRAYVSSQQLVIAFAVGSIVLALLLGLAISWSIIEPVRQMDARLRKIAAGDFSEHVRVPNRDELGTLAANLNRMNDELDRAYQQLTTASQHKSEFLANMSHELRTPLNAIIGFSEVLAERMFGDLNEKQEEYLRDILTSGQHLLALINDILDLSKVEAGQMELELGTFSLPEALENGLTMIRERAGNHGIALSLDVDPAVDLIEADERKVKQIVFNLLSNAVKFTPDGGEVDVSARIVDGVLTLAVRDTGIGIAPEDQAQVFEEFRQVGQSTRRQEGTGLGLALVRRFVELHGGQVTLESEVGVGSTFAFTLPAAVARDEGRGAIDDEPLATGLSSFPDSPSPLAPRPSPLVLVVEDDPASVSLLKLHLAAADFEVAVAHDGATGLELARQLRPVCIVLDIVLPVLDGWDVLVRAREDPALRSTPIVVVSMLDERGKGFALGAADYLLKPISADALLATIRRLARPPRRAATLLAVDDDPLAIELIRLALQPEGYTILTASGGAEAIELARQDLPDLIILDLLMPDVNGFAVVEALRSDPRTAEIPIVVLTSKTMTAEEKDRLNGRISHLAGKSSFDRAAFLALVHGLCPVAT
jgi:signal transduction histidine kinase/DNA-binding response OmpR family regulator